MAEHTFSFSPVVEEKIKRMMEKINTFQVCVVITEALQLYEWVIDERELGKRVGSIDKDNNVTVVKL